MDSSTIAAISTPPGEGAIGLVRISGPKAVAIADAVFQGRQLPSQGRARMQYHGAVIDGNARVDEVMLTVFRAPASYTGEDVVEIACHGGLLVTREILELVLRCGARLSHPGEFTERAYLNGKLDLTQAEAVMDLIAARTPRALRAATEQLEGRLGSAMRRLQDMLLAVLAEVEAYIDFPDEDIQPATGDALLAQLGRVQEDVEALLSTADEGRVLREGLKLVICGKPNVGKSSLMNFLLGYERAIVSATAGTTRDTIEEMIMVQGIPVRLTDTAGIHATEDLLEQAAMTRSLRSVDQADLVLHVVEGHLAPPDGFEPHGCVVANKCDLGFQSDWQNWNPVRFSTVTGEGRKELEACVVKSIAQGHGGAGSVAINARHKAALSLGKDAMERAAAGLGEGLAPELIALEIRSAMEYLGEVVGRVDGETLLGEIFSRFCIGK